MFKKPQNNKCTNRSNLKAIVSNSELYLKLISTDLYKAVTWNRVVFRSCCFLGFSAFEKCAGSGITKNSRTVPPSFHVFMALKHRDLSFILLLQFLWSQDCVTIYFLRPCTVLRNVTSVTEPLMSSVLFWAVLQAPLHLGQVKIGSRFCCTAWLSPRLSLGQQRSLHSQSGLLCRQYKTEW